MLPQIHHLFLQANYGLSSINYPFNELLTDVARAEISNEIKYNL